MAWLFYQNLRYCVKSATSNWRAPTVQCEHGKSRWKFDFTVNDRRHNAAARYWWRAYGTTCWSRRKSAAQARNVAKNLSKAASNGPHGGLCVDCIVACAQSISVVDGPCHTMASLSMAGLYAIPS